MNVSCPVIPNGTPARTIQLPDVRRVRPLQFRNPTASRTLSNNWMNVSGSRLAVQAVIRCCGRSFVQRLSPNAATLSIAFIVSASYRLPRIPASMSDGSCRRAYRRRGGSSGIQHGFRRWFRFVVRRPVILNRSLARQSLLVLDDSA